MSRRYNCFQTILNNLIPVTAILRKFVFIVLLFKIYRKI